MGTLGCINDMMSRDKENRELRNRNRERMNDTRDRLIEVGKGRELPDVSAEEIEYIRKNTVEKEKADSDKLFSSETEVCGSCWCVAIAVLFCLCADNKIGSTCEREVLPVCDYSYCYQEDFYSIIHFSIPLIVLLKLTPTFMSFLPSEAKGSAYCLSLICFMASSAVPSSLNSMT